MPLCLIFHTFVWEVLILSPVGGLAQELKAIRLPKPQTDIGRPLMQVLKDRSSARAFSPEKLPAQVMSNLLWAAFGVNRPDTGKRTAPSAVNWQETDVYVATHGQAPVAAHAQDGRASD
ncbi:MAG: nitroreductase family protein [Terriglobia bacterium]